MHFNLFFAYYNKSITENINDNNNQEKNKIHLCTESIEKVI